MPRLSTTCFSLDVAPTFRACPERSEGSAIAGLKASAWSFYISGEAFST
jgi:hypothetical protein